MIITLGARGTRLKSLKLIVVPYMVNENYIDFAYALVTIQQTDVIVKIYFPVLCRNLAR